MYNSDGTIDEECMKKMESDVILERTAMEMGVYFVVVEDTYNNGRGRFRNKHGWISGGMEACCKYPWIEGFLAGLAHPVDCKEFVQHILD